MNDIKITFAKLIGLHKTLLGIAQNGGRFLDPNFILEYFVQYAKLRDEVILDQPDLFSDLTIRPIPVSSGTTDFNGRGYIGMSEVHGLLRDISYIFDVYSHYRSTPIRSKDDQKVFISHGKSQDWLQVQAYIEKDIDIRTLELAQQPNKGRTVLQKLSEESDSCSYAVIVMTGDDDIGSGIPRARENVMHEIGFFQGKYGLDRVCLLYEDGTNIPSNIHGLVYIAFNKGNIREVWGELRRELEAAFNLSGS